ncbi:NUDIX domain-containing protein [Micromonospora sp. KC207]|uniref:NUDIX domain-containing protein n=1 Tax=Micromonospora sp. KC207 TaxID=2530377 RepID=UPI00104D7BBF|nr:NUDIX domain-containing protein [Micromonospora sp. KC207]TDC65680.1 NUDIX domain-containing protein [Micromonospora sp. KC207]
MSDQPTAFRIALDLAILTIRDGQLAVLLIERGKPPFEGRAALPGGFVRAGEDLDDTAVRELSEETGLEGRTLHLEQVRAYATPGRDPRGPVASVAYLAIAPDLPVPVAGTDAARARWESVDHERLGHGWLAFDHDTILGDALERARGKLEYSPLATAFCGETFSIGELRAVYEAVWQVRLDPRNFHRKVTGVNGFVVPTGQRRNPPTGRPAALYRRGDATMLYPALLRPGNGRQ